MKLKNKNIGAKVIVKEITIAINPKDGWKSKKKVSGVLVKNEGYEYYYHTCNGNHTSVRKHVIDSTWRGKYAVKLDNDIVDIEGNNIIRVDEDGLIFMEYLTDIEIISKKEYNQALKIIEKYDYQRTLK